MGIVVDVILCLTVFDRMADDGAYVVVDILACFGILAAMIYPVELAEAYLLRDAAEGVVESPGELLAFGCGVGTQRVDGFSEEEFGRCVHGLSYERSTMSSYNKPKDDEIPESKDLPYERRNLGC